MTVEQDLVSALEGDAALTALIGADNVHSLPIPKGAALPRLGYYLVDQPTTQTLTNAVFERKPRLTIIVEAEEPSSRAAVSEAVVTALLAMSGSVEIVDAGRDVPETVTRLYRRDIDVRFLR
jgi:hypothetical protein